MAYLLTVFSIKTKDDLGATHHLPPGEGGGRGGLKFKGEQHGFQE